MADHRKTAGETKKARSRAAVLAATAVLIQESGGDSITLAKIAERSGVSVPTILKHWGAKAALLAAVEAQAENASSLDFDSLSDEQLLARVYQMSPYRTGDADLRLARAALARWESRSEDLSLTVLSLLSRASLDSTERLGYAKRAASIAHRLGNNVARVAALQDQFGLLAEAGDLEAAYHVGRLAFDALDETDDQRTEKVYIAQRLASLTVGISDRQSESLQWAHRALELAQRSGANPEVAAAAVALGEIGEILHDQKAVRSALKVLDRLEIDELPRWAPTPIAILRGDLPRARLDAIRDVSGPDTGYELLNLVRYELATGHIQNVRPMLAHALEWAAGLPPGERHFFELRWAPIARQVEDQLQGAAAPAIMERSDAERLLTEIQGALEILEGGGVCLPAELEEQVALAAERLVAFVKPIPKKWYAEPLPAWG